MAVSPAPRPRAGAAGELTAESDMTAGESAARAGVATGAGDWPGAAAEIGAGAWGAGGAAGTEEAGALPRNRDASGSGSRRGGTSEGEVGPVGAAAGISASACPRDDNLAVRSPFLTNPFGSIASTEVGTVLNSSSAPP